MQKAHAEYPAWKSALLASLKLMIFRQSLLSCGTHDNKTKQMEKHSVETLMLLFSSCMKESGESEESPLLLLHLPQPQRGGERRAVLAL